MLNRKSKVVRLLRQQVVSFTVNDVCVTWFGINRPICSLLSPLQQQCHATDGNSYGLASSCSKIRAYFSSD